MQPLDHMTLCSLAGEDYAKP